MRHNSGRRLWQGKVGNWKLEVKVPRNGMKTCKINEYEVHDLKYRALANSSNSFGPDRRESAMFQEVHWHCPNFAIRSRSNLAVILVSQMGIWWTVAMAVAVAKHYDLRCTEHIWGQVETT